MVATVISWISTIWGLISWLPKLIIRMVKVGGREKMVQLRERKVSDKESNIDALLKLQQEQLQSPTSHVRIGIQSMDFNGTRGAHKPIAQISFNICNFLVNPTNISQVEQTPCQIYYPILQGRTVVIADRITLISHPTLKPCTITIVTASFELPIPTRDELIICRDKNTPVSWTIRPKWTFAMIGQPEFAAEPNELYFTSVPNIS